MSIVYCHYCDRHVDIDEDPEHFDTEEGTPEDYCIAQEQDEGDYRQNQPPRRQHNDTN